MRNITFILLSIFFISTSYSNPEGIFKRKQKGDDKEDGISVGLARAWVLYNNKDYYGALRIYRDLYTKAPANAKLNYRMGVCFDSMNQKDSSIFHIQKALDKDPNINPKAYYYLGKAYQFNEELDLAIENYYKFKNSDAKKKGDVNRLLRQCEMAKYMQEHPVEVEIKNLGPNINSKYVDASPSITADQQTLIFTSRREENMGGAICPSNEQYYDDIYISKWNADSNMWGKAENIGAPINTKGFDANLSISPDGQKIFLYKNIEGITGSGDIYVSSFNNDGKWSKPKAIDEKFINSSFFESSASITADGKTLYFISERERGGLGYGDIWVSKKLGGMWQKPTNIGPVINTEFDEIGVYIHPDGKTLFFSSAGHNAIGQHDIFISTKNKNGQWSEPINLGYPINTTKDEIHFVLSASKEVAYISSTRPDGFGMVDIYEIDMSNYFQTNKNIPSELAQQFTKEKITILKGSVVDGDSGRPIKAKLKIVNLKTNEERLINSEENGNYFTTLLAGEKYNITVTSKKYKTFSFKLKMSETASTTTKHVVLNKQ